jgi:hypothetical protein
MNVRRGAALTGVTAALLLTATDVIGQNPHRQGFWAEIGSGPAAARIGCTGCESVTRAAGSGGYLRLGGALSPRVLLGAEFFGFTDETFGFDSDDEGIVANSGTIMAVVLWYPWRSHVFVKSGVGLAEGDFTVEPTGEEPAIADGVGVGLTFGLGIDLPISRKFAITANASTFFTAIGDITLPNRTVDDVIPTTYMLSVGITLR